MGHKTLLSSVSVKTNLSDLYLHCDSVNRGLTLVRLQSMQRSLDDCKCNKKMMMMMMMKVTEILSCFYFKTARLDSSQVFMDTSKTIDLTRSCIQIANTVVFPIIHTSNLKKNMSVLSNTMFRFSRFRTTDIHRRTHRLGQ